MEEHSPARRIESAHPELPLDLYSDEAIRNPHALYRAIRDRGPVVWLPAHEVWAIGRFDDVRTALRADSVLVSGRGVAVNDLVNGQPAVTTLTSDGELHRRRRSVLMSNVLRGYASFRTSFR